MVSARQQVRLSAEQRQLVDTREVAVREVSGKVDSGITIDTRPLPSHPRCRAAVSASPFLEVSAQAAGGDGHTSVVYTALGLLCSLFLLRLSPAKYSLCVCVGPETLGRPLSSVLEGRMPAALPLAGSKFLGSVCFWRPPLCRVESIFAPVIVSFVRFWCLP